MRELNKDCIRIISNYADSKDNNSLVLSCSLFYKAIQPARIKQKITNNFIKSVAQGKLNEIDFFDDPFICLNRGNITDYSNRTFFNISAFQYALWALDLHGAVPLMLKRIIDSNDCNAFQTLLTQYQEVKNNCIKYVFNGESYNEQHYAYEPFLGQIRNHITYYEHWSAKKLSLNWQQIIKSQHQLPAHIAQYYCDSNKFNVNNLNIEYSKTRPLDYFNHKINKKDFWYPCGDSKIAQSKSGIVRGDLQSPSIWAGTKGSIKNLEQDLVTLTQLFQLRVQAFISFEQTLIDLVDKSTNYYLGWNNF